MKQVLYFDLFTGGLVIRYFVFIEYKKKVLILFLIKICKTYQKRKETLKIFFWNQSTSTKSNNQTKQSHNLTYVCTIYHICRDLKLNFFSITDPDPFSILWTIVSKEDDYLVILRRIFKRVVLLNLIFTKNKNFSLTITRSNYVCDYRCNFETF